MGCSRDFCKILSHAGRADRSCVKNLKANILSAEAKVLSVLVDNPECVVKDIHSLTGLSERHSYNAVKNLISAGVVKKINGEKDKRTKILKIVKDELCEKVCRFI